MNENLAKWAAETTGGDSLNTIGKNSSIVVSTLSRQWPDKLSADNVVKIARAYGVNVFDALIAQGLLTPGDIESAQALDALQDASDDQLVMEIARRLPDASEVSPLVQPLDNVTDPGDVWGRQASTESILDDLEGLPYSADVRRDHEDDPVEP